MEEELYRPSARYPEALLTCSPEPFIEEAEWFSPLIGIPVRAGERWWRTGEYLHHGQSRGFGTYLISGIDFEE